MEHMYVVEHNGRWDDGWQICDDFIFKSTDDAIKYVEWMAGIYQYENLTYKTAGDTIHVNCTSVGGSWTYERFRIVKWRISDGVFN